MLPEEQNSILQAYQDCQEVALWLTLKQLEILSETEEPIVMALISWVLSYLWMGTSPKPATEKYLISPEIKESLHSILEQGKEQLSERQQAHLRGYFRRCFG